MLKSGILSPFELFNFWSTRPLSWDEVIGRRSPLFFRSDRDCKALVVRITAGLKQLDCLRSCVLCRSFAADWICRFRSYQSWVPVILIAKQSYEACRANIQGVLTGRTNAVEGLMESCFCLRCSWRISYWVLVLWGPPAPVVKQREHLVREIFLRRRRCFAENT